MSSRSAVARSRPAIDAPASYQPETPEPKSRPDGILVLGKVQAVLAAFTGDRERAGPSEIAAGIGANKSSTYRLLNSMAKVGLLDRSPDGTFGLGLWLMELGSLVGSRIDLRSAASSELNDLQRATGLTAFLTVLHGHQATCIDRLPGSNVDVLALRLGGVLPLCCGAGPRTLLAFLSPQEQERYLAGAPFEARTTHSLTSASALRDDVERTRREGYVVSMEDVTLGVAAIGAPVFDSSGHVVAAVSVAGLRHEFEGERELRLASIVKSTARRISAALGGAAWTK